jgi:class 3 adenylate cyclase/tetratricopeptide (TPR) repeat protein
MRVFYTFLIFLSALLFTGFAAKATPDEQSKVNQLIELSTAYRFSDINKSISTIDEALGIAQKIDYKAGIAECYLKKGQYLFNNGSQKESGENLQKAADIFKKIDSKGKYAICLKELADYYNTIGNTDKAKELIKQSSAIATELKDNSLTAQCDIASGIIDMNAGKFAEATAHYLNALRTAESIKNDEIIMNSCRELGNINSLQGNVPLSNEYYNKALAINLKIGNKLGLADVYCNIGSNYLTLGNQQEAMVNIKKSLELARSLNYKPTIALDLLNMGYCLTYQNNYDGAGKEFDEAQTVFAELNDKHGQAEVMNAKGYLLAKTHNFEEAAKSYLASADIAKTINANDQLKTSYDGLAYIFEQRKDYEAAYKFQKLAQGLSNEIYNTSNTQMVTKLQLNYDFEKMQEQQRIQQGLKDKINESEKKRTRYFTYFLIVLGLMAIILAAVVYVAYRANKKAKELLVDKNELITKEKERAERILSDIIPAEIEDKIKQSGIGQIESFATVMFIDFYEFTKTEQRFSPVELMDELDLIFKGMDDISKKFKLETLKTLSDGYLCIGGSANSLDCKPEDVVNAAIKIQLYMEEIKMKHVREGQPYFEMRIGIHTGQIAGGIVGVRTIAADIWGEAVQAASLMEKMANAGEIRVSEATFQLVKSKFETIYCGKLKASAKEIQVYQISNFKTEFSQLTVSKEAGNILNKLRD